MWGLMFLLLAACPMAQAADDQSGNVPSAPPGAAPVAPRKIPTDAVPYLVERRKNLQGASFDMRRRIEMNLGEPRQGCAAWRIEYSAQPDGRVIFQLNDPADKKVLLDEQYDSRSLEFVIGDKKCNYRIRIERNE
jgi:hypothetical protein